jgi:tol-pal system protein YbgF
VKSRLLPAGLLLLVPAAAAAANKDIERLQVQVATLQVQIADLQRIAQDNQRELRRLSELFAEQSALLRRVADDQKLQGETIQNALRESAERMAQIGERLQSAQLAVLPPAGAATPVEGAEPGAPPPPPPRELYSQAYADYARGNYDLAIQSFQEYLKHYPDTDFADNAQYWIGECLYGKQDYEPAIEAWNTLLRDYPSSDKLPDARVKKGMALERLGRRSQALLEYRFVVERYPNAPAARLARERLNPQ